MSSTQPPSDSHKSPLSLELMGKHNKKQSPADSALLQPTLHGLEPSRSTPEETTLNSRSINPIKTELTKIIHQGLLDDINQKLKSGQLQPAIQVAKILVLIELREFTEVHKCLDQLLENLSEKHALYGAACFLKGHALLIEHGFLYPVEYQWFATALQHDFPMATPFLMAQCIGLFPRHSQVKWRDCVRVIELMEKLPDKLQPFQHRMNQYLIHIQRTDNTSLLTRKCCTLIAGFVNNIFVHWKNQKSPMGFTSTLCHLYTCSDQATAQTACNGLARWLEDAKINQPDQHWIYRTYSNHIFGMLVDNPESWYQILVKHDNDDFSQFCAADIRARQSRIEKDGKRQQQMRTEAEALYLRAADTMPKAFDVLGEFLIENHQMEKARDVYQQGIDKINAFLAGETNIFDYQVGANAEKYRKDNPELADEINLDELSTCEELQRLFEAKRHLCETVLEEMKTHATVSSSSTETKKKRKKKSKFSPKKTETTGPEHQATKKPTQETTTVKPPEPNQPLSTEPQAQDDPKDPKTASPEASTSKSAAGPDFDEKHIRKILKEANKQIQVDQNYKKALTSLQNDCSVPRTDPLWFKRKQHMAWCYLQESQDDLYLLKNFPENPAQKRNELHKKARKEVREGLNKLVKMRRPDNQTDVLHIPVTELMDIAKELEQDNPGLRIELGSLYSTMGHILKAERDILNPRTQSQKTRELVQQASGLFQLAHRILGKRLG